MLLKLNFLLLKPRESSGREKKNQGKKTKTKANIRVEQKES